MTDKPDKTKSQDENNESLVMALESIKGLLAIGEKNRNKDHDSIDIANSHDAKSEEETKPEVPVLQDIIIPGKPVPSKPIPEETSLENNEQVQAATATSKQPKIDAEALYTFQTQLEHELHDKLLTYVIQLEDELKEKIEAYIKEQLEK